MPVGAIFIKKRFFYQDFFVQEFFSTKDFFRPKTFFDQIFSLYKSNNQGVDFVSFFGSKIFFVKDFFTKIFFVQEFFSTKDLFRPYEIFDQKLFSTKFFPYTRQIIKELTLFPFSDQKFFWGQNNFLGLKHLRLKFFQSKIFFGLKFFQTKNYCS